MFTATRSSFDSEGGGRWYNVDGVVRLRIRRCGGLDDPSCIIIGVVSTGEFFLQDSRRVSF